MREVLDEDGAVIDGLERFEPPPYTPPRRVMLALLGLPLLVAGAFVVRGASQAWTGYERLTSTLLDVKPGRAAAIEFELESMSGERVTLQGLGSKTVFLNFWATWCPPCIEEMPSLRRLHARLNGHPSFVFLAVSADEGWTPVRRFFENDPAPFPVLLDPKGRLAGRYGTSKFPETYVIRDGRILGHIVGPRDWDRWYAEAWLREVLEEG